MSYPERGATYKNRPAWLDRAVEGEKRADGGDVGWKERFVGRGKLRDEMGGKPPPLGFDFTRSKTQAEDTMRGQMGRAKDISDAVPRGTPAASDYEMMDSRAPPAFDEMARSSGGRTRRADGGMTNSRLAQVDPDFEPSAAADARNSAAERIRNTRAMPKRKD